MLHRKVCEACRGEELGFLKCTVPYSSTVEQMGVHRAPVAEFSPSSQAARAFQALWNEIEERTGSDKNPKFPRKKQITRLLRELDRA